jgi:RNA-directed DNA polymerase
MEEGAVRRSANGTPQGGVVSPLLCNVYLHRLDRDWQTRGQGVLVRYADDLVVMCKTEPEARYALETLQTALSELGLDLKQAKTRIVHLREGGEGFDFLGFHHRYVRGRTRRSRHITFLARWPSRQAMQHARDRIRELTGRERLLLPVEEVVQDVNSFLRGWVGYFRYGNSARPFDKIDRYAVTRLCEEKPYARFDGGREKTNASRLTSCGTRRLPPTRPPSVAAVEADGATEEADCGGAFLVGQHFAVGKSVVVVDGDVDVLVADSAALSSASVKVALLGDLLLRHQSDAPRRSSASRSV